MYAAYIPGYENSKSVPARQIEVWFASDAFSVSNSLGAGGPLTVK